MSCHPPPIDGAPIRIPWTRHGFDKFEIYRHVTIGHGHCLMHSIAQSIFVCYREKTYSQRSQMVVDLRSEIADKLSAHDPKTGLTYYEGIANGNLADLGRHDPDHSMAGIKRLFRSNQFLGEEMLGILSYMLDKSIYILDLANEDIYLQAGCPDPSLPSIVCIYTGGHFETVSIRSPAVSGLISHFLPTHSFIMFLQDRIRSFKKM